VLARPIWGTLRRAAGGWHHAALGGAPGSGRAARSTLTAHPAWSGAARAFNERGTGRCEGSRTCLKTPVSFSETRLEPGENAPTAEKREQDTQSTVLY